MVRVDIETIVMAALIPRKLTTSRSSTEVRPYALAR